MITSWLYINVLETQQGQNTRGAIIHHPPLTGGDVGQGQFLFRLLRALKWWETLGGNDAKPCVKCELQRIS